MRRTVQGAVSCLSTPIMSSEKRTKAVDLSHHISDYARRYVPSPLKGLQKHFREDLITFAGGELSFLLPSRKHDHRSYRSSKPRLLSLRFYFRQHPPHRRLPAHRAACSRPHFFLALQLAMAHLWWRWRSQGRHNDAHRGAPRTSPR